MILLAKTAPLRARRRGPTGTWSLVGIAFSQSSTIGWPGGIAAGDQAYLFDLAVNSTTTPPSSVTPSGMAAVPDTSSQTDASGGVGSRLNCWQKTLVGGESTLTGMTGSAAIIKALGVFRKSAGVVGTPTSVSQSLSNSGATPGSQSIVVGAAPQLVIGANLFGALDGSFSPAATGSQEEADTSTELFYSIFNTAPANVTFNRGAGAFGLVSFAVPLV